MRPEQGFACEGWSFVRSHGFAKSRDQERIEKKLLYALCVCAHQLAALWLMRSLAHLHVCLCVLETKYQNLAQYTVLFDGQAWLLFIHATAHL